MIKNLIEKIKLMRSTNSLTCQAREDAKILPKYYFVYYDEHYYHDKDVSREHIVCSSPSDVSFNDNREIEYIRFVFKIPNRGYTVLRLKPRDCFETLLELEEYYKDKYSDMVKEHDDVK